MMSKMLMMSDVDFPYLVEGNWLVRGHTKQWKRKPKADIMWLDKKIKTNNNDKSKKYWFKEIN